MTHPASPKQELREEKDTLQKALETLAQHNITKRRDMPWTAFLVELLHVAATLEHKLMVQYLFAAYTLGGPQVPEEYRDTVRAWQETLLTIAREEMGHLLTVQNILTFLGAEVNFADSEFTWQIEYFGLEPVTLDSLACYVFVEMNVKDVFPEKEEIARRACKHLRVREDQLIPVEDLYMAIIALFSDEEKIPQSALRPQSYLTQATWDDWGRGYGPLPRPADAEGSLDGPPAPLIPDRAILLINNVVTRTQTIEALKALSDQGEGPTLMRNGRRGRPTLSEGYTMEGQDPREPSHFTRFIKIYREMKAIHSKKWSPALPVAVNPWTTEEAGKTYISCKHSRDWADLFNLRYRMLLKCLAHTFRLARSTRHDEPSVRAVSMHRVFCEMYNLKTIAKILVQLPLTGEPGDHRRAGSPFLLPNTHSLPATDGACWRLYIDMLKQADGLCREILKAEKLAPNRHYLLASLELDAQRVESIERMQQGSISMERGAS
jgi:rubrerythrin